jgi:hypothetical protein
VASRRNRDGEGSHPYALGFLLGLSLLGLGMSLGTHVATLSGIDPGEQFRQIWLLQLILVALLLPIGVELLSKRNPYQILRSPPWMRRTLYLLLVYYGANFYVFLYWSADHVSSRVTWRMFSSGWLLLFAFTALYYSVRLLESKGNSSKSRGGNEARGRDSEDRVG